MYGMYFWDFLIHITGMSLSCMSDKVFHDFYQCWQNLSCIPLSNQWDRSCNSVVKTDFGSWLHCVVTYVNFQYGGWQSIGPWPINSDSYVKIKCWRSNDMQEKESIMGCLCLVWIEKSVPRDHCLESFGKALWCQEWEIFLSASHIWYSVAVSMMGFRQTNTCSDYVNLVFSYARRNLPYDKLIVTSEIILSQPLPCQ